MKIAQPNDTKPTEVTRSANRPRPGIKASRTETMAAPAWHLPGGMRLAEYAMRGGFVASTLLARGGRER